jgi:succinate dehydrogenase/fumarate reductase-like Fe-S protein
MSQLNLHLKVWRQNAGQPGHFQDIEAPEIPDHASFLEMMDIVNERLISKGQEPVAFDHDCREGICGMCSMQINGVPHGPEKGHDNLPASHAQVPHRRHDLGRALPREGLPRHQGPRR